MVAGCQSLCLSLLTRLTANPGEFVPVLPRARCRSPRSVVKRLQQTVSAMHGRRTLPATSGCPSEHDERKRPLGDLLLHLRDSSEGFVCVPNPHRYA
jgi:hypothetical protein